MKIVDVKAYPISFPLPLEARVTLGIGQAVKRDAVVVKVTTDGGSSGTGSRIMAASIHFLAAIENSGYFEADVSKKNAFRDELVSRP